MWKDDAYLLDILIAAQKAQEFTKGLDRSGFEANEMAQQAALGVSDLPGLIQQIEPWIPPETEP